MDTSEVNGVAEHRRRRRNAAMEPQEEQFAAPQQSDQAPEPAQQAGQNEAPRRRRRAQPPRQITQKLPKISVPEDAPVPQLPVIEEPKPEKKRYTKATRRPEKAEQADAQRAKERREKALRALKTGADAGGKAARTAGGVLLVLLMALAAGGRKLGALLVQLAGWIRTKTGEYRAGRTGAQQPQEEIVLEAIRPQDYHGRGAQHAAQQTVKQSAKRLPAKFSGDKTQRLISAALLIVAAVSLWQIGSILLRTYRTTKLNAQLSERYASLSADAQDGQETDGMTFAVYDGGETPAPEQTVEPDAAQEMEEAAEIQAMAEPEAAAEPEATPEPKATAAPELVKTTKFHHVGGDALPEMEALYNENRDLVAWLNIPDVIDLPVVYRDNDYYLKRDFYKQKNTAGTIFLDENHPFKEKTQNLLLHGHNMKDGTMFGRLTQYIYDRTYIKNHPFINLSTLWRREQYVIFAVLDVSLNPADEAFFNYFTHSTFSSDAEFTSYIRQLQLRSMFAIPIDVKPDDALLTLSTCLEENRLVIVARRLRSGETRQELRNLIHMSTRQ